MKKLLLLSSLLASTLATQAQVTPKVQPETLVNGKEYLLVNRAQNANQYTSRTSWDGALYFLGESDSKYADHLLTAIDNGDGTWSFRQQNGTKTVETGEFDIDQNPITEEVPVYNYLVIPAGTDNVNLKETDPVFWTVTASETFDNFYQLKAGEGNNPNCMGKFLHLNAGGQYFVISEAINGGQWFPDFYGGAEETGEFDVNEDPIYNFKDPTSLNWGFVSADNIPAYYTSLAYVAAFDKIAQHFDDDEFGEGYQATYNAAKAIYDGATTLEELEATKILAMLQAKIDLQAEIEKAILLNEEPEDAVLQNAIDAAISAFNNKTDADEVAAAVETLAEAELNFSLGNGDVTALGTNMSFEDLSAQGGNATSGVAAPPAGWNILINGTPVTSEAEVRAAGMTAWHGVNADCTGDEKDGNYGFGIWNGSIPNYELSQTINNIENGSYIVRAALMVGANGNGSRRTTQRIFANLNSTYFGYDYDYDEDELDKSEVYDFAGLTEPQTDTELQGLEVRAFVYDGTLTFGVRTDGNYKAALRTSGNGAGGDGWFKVDNFTIQKVSYEADDALNILTHYAELIDDYVSEAAMSDAKRTKAEGLQEVYTNIDETSAQEDIVKAILDAKDMLVEISASVKAYQRLRDAIDKHYDYRDMYDYKKGIQDYSDAIDEADAAYGDALLDSDEDIDALIAALDDALQACIQSDDIEAGDDLTDYIQNPSFEDLSAQNNSTSNGVANAPKGWNLYVDGNQVNSVAEAGVSGWCAINSGDNLNITNTQGEEVTHQYTDGEYLWGLWSDAVPVIEISQTVKGLPAGTYKLSADIVVQNDWAGANLGMQRLFANDYVTMFGAEEDYIQNTDETLYETFPGDVRIAAEIDRLSEYAPVAHLNYAGNYSAENYGASGAPYTTTVTFGLAEKGDVTFGFRSSRISPVTGQLVEQASFGWFKLDNFRLVFESTEVPAGADITGEETEIDEVEESAQSAVEFYNLNGVRLTTPQKGVNLVKMANGNVVKTYVK